MPTARILVVGLFVVIIAILSGIVQDVQDAQAIPAFARKYDFACNVCHVPSFPKLNDFGNLFRDHGYQLGTDQELPTYEGLTKGYWPVSLRTTVGDRKSTRLNSSHLVISYAVFCLKKKKIKVEYML